MKRNRTKIVAEKTKVDRSLLFKGLIEFVAIIRVAIQFYLDK